MAVAVCRGGGSTKDCGWRGGTDLLLGSNSAHLPRAPNKLVVSVTVRRGFLLWFYLPRRLLQFLSWAGNRLLVPDFVPLRWVVGSMSGYAAASIGLGRASSARGVGDRLGRVHCRCGMPSGAGPSYPAGCWTARAPGSPFSARDSVPNPLVPGSDLVYDGREATDSFRPRVRDSLLAVSGCMGDVVLASRRSLRVARFAAGHAFSALVADRCRGRDD